MFVLVLAVPLVVALFLGALGVHAPGAADAAPSSVLMIHWILLLSCGAVSLLSGTMHTLLRKTTAENIGWATSPFQLELGYLTYGLGVASIVASFLGQDAWIVITIITTFFMFGTAALHIQEMIKEHNFAPGNTLVLFASIPQPVVLWALLISAGVI
jgi:hypothetical protein